MNNILKNLNKKFWVLNYKKYYIFVTNTAKILKEENLYGIISS